MRKHEEHYQLVIKVTVISGGIDTSASYCTLDGYNSAHNLKIGNKVRFNFYFKNGRWKDVKI